MRLMTWIANNWPPIIFKVSDAVEATPGANYFKTGRGASEKVETTREEPFSHLHMHRTKDEQLSSAVGWLLSRLERDFNSSKQKQTSASFPPLFSALIHEKIFHAKAAQNARNQMSQMNGIARRAAL